MASDYEAITKDNIRRRGEEFADIGRFLAEKLYGDRSHFIYELLQNAEDALARRRQDEPGGEFPCDVKFRLCKDHLEVSHYGKRFDEEDVRSICDVLRGTKSERLDQIGTFGIGFKSVYAFTESPEIHSGEEHFVIQQFIRPREVAARKLEGTAQTLFYFPFDHPEFKAISAFNLIQAKLKSLGPRSLLFLHHVKDLHWVIEDAGKGLYIRDAQPSVKGGAIVKIVGECSNQKDTEEDWLVIQRDVQHPTRHEKLPVKMAYSLRSSREGQSVQPLPLSPLTVYFPTAKETGLSFLIHGPFAATPARDNIQSDSPWNNLLLSELAVLAAESLAVCQKHGLLTGDFLAALPIDEEAFPMNSPFRAIYETVLQALKTQPLIPTADGGHARAADLVLGRSEDLRDLLPPELLRELLGPKSTCVGWVDPSVTENRLPKVWQYLRDECETLVIDGETFARHITGDFLDPRGEDWMIRFYSFLTGQEALWRPKGVYNYPPEGPLRKKPIIRCDDGSHVCPFAASGDLAVFAPSDDTPRNASVKRSIYEDAKARAFFGRLGVRGRDPADDVIDMLLERYSAAEATYVGDDYNAHLNRLFRALTTDSHTLKDRLLNTARSSFLAVSVNMAGEQRLLRPTEVYVPRDELKRYFAGDSDVRFLDVNALSPDNLDFEKWKGLGAADRPRMIRTVEKGRSEPRRHDSSWAPKFENWEMAGLDDALARLNTIDRSEAILVSRSIWTFLKEIVREQSDALMGLYSWFYYKWKREEMESSFLCRLKKASWLPSIGGELKMPAELRGDELHDSLTPDPFLRHLLGFKPDPEEVAKETLDTRKALVIQAGFSPEVAALFLQNKDALTPEIIHEILEKKAAARRRLQTAGAEPVAYHEALAEAFARPASREGQQSAPAGGASADPKRRRERTGAEIAAALDAEPSPESRVYFGVCCKWKGKDDAVCVALLTWYAGKCQICGETFTQRNGAPYFEGVYLVPYTRAEWLDRVGNVVCVCAWHSAMLQFGPLEAGRPILDQILALKTAAEGGAPEQSCLRLTLCGEQVNLQYAEKHFIDLQEMIKASQKATDAEQASE